MLLIPNDTYWYIYVNSLKPRDTAVICNDVMIFSLNKDEYKPVKDWLKLNFGKSHNCLKISKWIIKNGYLMVKGNESDRALFKLRWL